MGTHFKGSNEEIIVLDTYIKFLRSAESLTNRINIHLAESKLTFTQFSIIEALYYLGPLSQKAIAKKVLKSNGNVTLVIDNLEKHGLVKREKVDKDRRFYSINLTPEGINLVEKVFPIHLKKIMDEFKTLNTAEMLELQRLCVILGKQDEE